MLALALAFGLPAAAQARYASIVIDFETGQVLHQTNADTRNYPASLVKMMTLYLTFEALERGNLTLDQELPVSPRAAGMPPSRLGLKADASIKVEDAILALLTKSANDVAVVMAEALGTKESRFARLMTKKARELGMKRTSFRNASGLPNRGQLSTARDMATLAQALIRDFPQYYELFSTTDFTYNGRTYRSHNSLLRAYEGADGLKTGYTRASGFNLAASAVRDGRRLIAVVFGGKSPRSRDQHVAKLLDRSFVKVASLGVGEAPLPPERKPEPALAGAAPEAVEPARPEADAAVPPGAPEMGSAEVAAPERIWGVQVGAYYRYRLAESAAVAAAGHLPDLLGETRLFLPHIKGQRGRIYRARLVGLTESGARNACQRLAELNTDCLVVRADSALALRLRPVPLATN